MKHLKWILTFCIALGLAVLFAVTAGAATKGDIDGDGNITAGDARAALRISVGLDNCAWGSAMFHAADIDTDGMITAGDARLILRVAVGIELSGDDMLIMAITNEYAILFDDIYYDGYGNAWYELLLQNKTGSYIEFNFTRDNANGCMLGQYGEVVTLSPYETTWYSAIPFDTEDAAPYDLSLSTVCCVRIPYDVYKVDTKTGEYTEWLGGDDISIHYYSLYGAYYTPSFDDEDYNYTDGNFRFIYYGSGTFYDDEYVYYRMRLFAQNYAGEDLLFVITPTAVNGITLTEEDSWYNEWSTEIYSDHCGFFDLRLYRFYESSYSVLDKYGISPDNIYYLQFDISVYTASGELIYTDNWELT